MIYTFIICNSWTGWIGLPLAPYTRYPPRTVNPYNFIIANSLRITTFIIVYYYCTSLHCRRGRHTISDRDDLCPSPPYSRQYPINPNTTIVTTKILTVNRRRSRTSMCGVESNIITFMIFADV